MVDKRDLWNVRGHRSFEMISRFESCRQANAETIWNLERDLIAATFDSMRTDPHSSQQDCLPMTQRHRNLSS